MTKEDLSEKVWGDPSSNYYDIQEINERIFDHPGYKEVLEYLRKSKISLDVGCGDGAKTCLLAKESCISYPYGVDISKYAIDTAAKSCSKVKFILSDIESLSFEDEFFDLVYSGFVLEHTENTEVVLKEVSRVLRRGGIAILMCPNYGSPNRSSPCFKGSRILKLLKGLLRDFFPTSGLKWNKVEPISKIGHKHVMDHDTTVEPYSLTLKTYLESIGFETLKSSSLWSLDEGNRLDHKLYRFLGNLNIFPWKHWGPQILYIGKKS